LGEKAGALIQESRGGSGPGIGLGELQVYSADVFRRQDIALRSRLRRILQLAGERIKWAKRGEVSSTELKSLDAVRFSAANTCANADATVLDAAIALQASLSAEIHKLTNKQGE
jgi:hypothetical protein